MSQNISLLRLLGAVWQAAEVRYGSKMTHSGVLVLKLKGIKVW